MPRKDIAHLCVPGRRGERLRIIGAYTDHRDGIVFVCEREAGGRGVAVLFSPDRRHTGGGNIYPAALTAFLRAAPGERFSYGMKSVRKLTRIETEVLAGELLTEMIVGHPETEEQTA